MKFRGVIAKRKGKIVLKVSGEEDELLRKTY